MTESKGYKKYVNIFSKPKLMLIKIISGLDMILQKDLHNSETV